jgi:hypothetical protein
MNLEHSKIDMPVDSSRGVGLYIDSSKGTSCWLDFDLWTMSGRSSQVESVSIWLGRTKFCRSFRFGCFKQNWNWLKFAFSLHPSHPS